ncbi:hypothetical protein D9M69_530960 [compost metagenome]
MRISRPACASSSFLNKAVAWGVSIRPGTITLQRTWCCAYWRATTRVMWFSAAFEVLYDRNCIGLHLRLAMEEMLMMEPPPWRIMCGTTSRAVSMGPLRLMACTRSQDSSVTSISSPNSSMPTLWCSTSMRPKLAMQCATICPICSLLRTSASKASAMPPMS